MKRRLWAIGTVGAIAPFVGLFGTVIGIIRAFADIAKEGAGGFAVVASGVSEALVATAGGIAIAVLAVAFYNYFQSRANRATVEVKLVVDEFLEQLATRGDGGMSQGLRPELAKHDKTEKNESREPSGAVAPAMAVTSES
jgi:biopolymer transport protein ExbB/TolQ